MTQRDITCSKGPQVGCFGEDTSSVHGAVSSPSTTKLLGCPSLFLNFLCFANEILSFQGFSSFKSSCLFSSHTLIPPSFSVCTQQASFPGGLVCPDSVNGRCCALNKLIQTRHVWITCFKINPVVHRSLGSTLVGTGWHRHLVLRFCLHVVSPSRTTGV